MSCGWLCFAAHGLLDLCSNMVLRAESISIQRWNNKVMPWTLMLWGTLREVARSSGRAHKCIDTSGSIHRKNQVDTEGKASLLSPALWMITRAQTVTRVVVTSGLPLSPYSVYPTLQLTRALSFCCWRPKILWKAVTWGVSQLHCL